MERFVCNSRAFWDELGNNAHHAGEVGFLRSITRPGMRVMDIGANRGVTAVALAKQVARQGKPKRVERQAALGRGPAGERGRQTEPAGLSAVAGEQ